MEQLFLDPWILIYVVIGLVPNLLLMLWAIARLSREVRLLYAKMGMLESDVRLIDQSLNAQSEERRAQGGAQKPPEGATGGGGLMGKGGFW